MSSQTEIDKQDAEIILGLLEDCPWEVSAPKFRARGLRLLEKIRPLLPAQRESVRALQTKITTP